MEGLGEFQISVGLDTSAIDKDINNLGTRYKNANIKIPVELPNFDKKIKQWQSQISAFDFGINLKVDQQQILRIRNQLQRQISIPVSIQNTNSVGVQKIKADIDAKAFDGVGDRLTKSITDSFGKVGDNLSESLGKSIKKALPSKGIFSGIFEGIGNAIISPIKAVGRGIFEGIGQPIGQSLGSGIQLGIDQVAGSIIGDSQLLGEKIAISLGAGIKEVLPQVLGNELSKKVNSLLENVVGIDDILVRSRSRQVSKQKQFIKQKEEASPLLRQEYIQSIGLKSRGNELEQELNTLKLAYEKQLQDFQKRFNQEANRLKNRSLLIKVEVSPEQVAESINKGMKAAGQSTRVSAADIAPEQVVAHSEAATSKARNEYVALGLRSQFGTEKTELDKQFQELNQKTTEFNQIVAQLSHGLTALQAAGGLEKQEIQFNQPDIYRQIALEVAKASGVEISSKQLPKVIPSSSMKEDATGQYSPEQNAINISEKAYQDLLSGNIDIKSIETIVHELRHALQFNFGNSDVLKTKTPAIDLIQPTPQEIKALGKKIESSTASQPIEIQGLLRKLETDAYTFAGRNTKKIFENISKTLSVDKFEQSAGIGGSKIDAIIKASQKAALNKIFKIRELATEYGIDLSQEIADSIKEFDAISAKMEPLFEKARSIELLPKEEIETIFNELQKEVGSAIPFINEQVERIKIALLSKKEGNFKKTQDEQQSSPEILPEVYKNIFSQVSAFSGLNGGEIPKLENITSDLQEFFKKTGTIAAYLSKTNKIALNPQAIKSMQSGQPLSYEAVGSTIHEMRHAAQLGFGQISTQDLAKGKIAIDLLIPTPEELEIFKDELEKSVASAKISMPEVPEDIIRAIEADAYLFEMLYGQNIFDTINETSKVIEKALIGNKEASKASNELEQNIKARLVQMQPKLIREIAKSFNVQISSSTSKGYLPKNELISNLLKKVDPKDLDFHVPIINEPSKEVIEYAKEIASLPIQEAEATLKEIYASISSALKETIKPDPANTDIKSLVGLLDEIEEAHQLMILMMSNADKELFDKLKGFRVNLVKLKQQGTLARLNAEFQQIPSNVAVKNSQTVEQLARVGGVLSAAGVVGNKSTSLNEIQKRFDQLYSKAQKELKDFNKVFDSLVPPTPKPGVLNSLKHNLDLAYRKGVNFVDTFKINLTVYLDKLLHNFDKYSNQVKFIENLPSLPSRIRKASIAERGVKVFESANNLSELAFNRAQSAEESDRPKKLSIASDIAQELDKLEAFIAAKDFKGIGKVTRNIEKGFKNLGVSSQELSTLIGHNESQITESIRKISGVFSNLDENIQTLTGRSLSDLGKTAFHTIKTFLTFQSLGWLQNWLQNVGAQTLELATRFQTLQRTITFITGSPAKGADTMAFLKSETKRVSGNYQAAVEGYKTIAASSRGTRLEGDQTREVFSAVNQASAVYGLTNEQTTGALLAVSQMISKGVISAEELRGQLSERIPGALQIMARALGVTEREMGKLLETGSLTSSEVLPKFARQMAMETAGGVAGAANTAQGALNRFNNTIQEIQIAVGSAALPAQVVGFNLLSGALGFLADNANTIIPVITALVAVIAGHLAISLSGVAKGFLQTAFAAQISKASIIGWGGVITGAILKPLMMLALQTAAIFAVFKAIEAAWNMASVAIGKNDLSDWADRTEKNIGRIEAAMNRLNNKQEKPDSKPDILPAAGWWDIPGHIKNNKWLLPPVAIGEWIGKKFGAKQEDYDKAFQNNFQSYADWNQNNRRDTAAKISTNLLPLSNAASELISGFTGGNTLAEAIKQSKAGKFSGKGVLTEMAMLDADIARKQIDKMAVSRVEGNESIRAKQIQSEIDALTERRSKAAKEVAEIKGQLSQQINELREKIKGESDPQIKMGMQADLEGLERLQGQLQRIETQAGISSANAIVRFAEAMRELGIAIAESSGKAQEWLSTQNLMASKSALDNFSRDRLSSKNLQGKQLENQRDSLKMQLADQSKAKAQLDGLLADGNNQALLSAAGVDSGMTPERLRAIAETTKDGQQKAVIESLARAKELNRDKLKNEEQLAQTELQIKQHAEQVALGEIQRSAALAQMATKASETARTSEVQKSGLNRKLTEEQVAEQLAGIQLDSRKQGLMALQQEQLDLDSYYSRGIISAEQYDERKRELGNRFIDEQKSLADAEIALVEAANRRKIADYEFTTRKREAVLEASFTKETNRIKGLQATGKLSQREAEQELNKAQKVNIKGQIGETKQQLAEVKQQESSKIISPRQAAEKRIQLNQKLAQLDQQLADNQIQANQQALQKLELANQRAEASIDKSQQSRITIIKNAQAKGELSERQAQQKLVAVQVEFIPKQIANTQRLITQNQQAIKQGLISQEEAKTKEIELNKTLTQQRQQLADATLQSKQAEIQAIDFANQRAEASIDKSQQSRITIIKNAQAKGELSERQAQQKLVAVQVEFIPKQIANTQRLITQNQQAIKQGLISQEEAKTKEIELNKTLTQQRQQLADATLQSKQAEIQAIDFANQQRQTKEEIADQTRLNAIKKRQSERKITDIQAQQEITQAQGIALTQQVNLVKDKIAQEKDLLAKGKRSREDSITKQLELQKQLGSLVGQQIDNEIKKLDDLRNALDKVVALRESQNNLVNAKAGLKTATREADLTEAMGGEISPLAQLQLEKANLMAEQERIARSKALIAQNIKELPSRKLSADDEKIRRNQLLAEQIQADTEFQRNRAALAKNEKATRDKSFELGIGLSSGISENDLAKKRLEIATREAELAEASGGIAGAEDALAKIELQRQTLQAQQNNLFAKLEINQREQAKNKERLAQSPQSQELKIRGTELQTQELDIRSQIAGNRKALAENVGEKRDKKTELDLAKVELENSRKQLEISQQELAVMRSGLPYNKEQFKLQSDRTRLLAEQEILTQKVALAQAKADSLKPGASEQIRIKLTRELYEAQLALGNNERAILENNRDLAINKADQTISYQKRLADAETAILDKQKQQLEISSKLLDIKKQLSDSRDNLSKAITEAGITETQSRLTVAERAVEAAKRIKEDENLDPGVRAALEQRLRAAGLNSGVTVASATENKQNIENQLAQERINARLQEEEIARRQLELELERNRLSAQMQQSEANITLLKTRQAELEAKQNVDKAKRQGDSEAIANSESQLELAKQSTNYAQQQVDIANKTVNAQDEIASNERKRLSVQQKSAATQSQTTEEIRKQDQALEGAEAKTSKMAKNTEKTADNTRASTLSLSLISGSREAQMYDSASTAISNAIRNSAGGSPLKGLIQASASEGDNPFFQQILRAKGFGDVADIINKLNSLNPLEASGLRQAILFGNNAALAKLQQMSDKLDNMASSGDINDLGSSISSSFGAFANRPTVGTLNVNSANPTTDAGTVIRDISSNRMRGIN